MSEKLPMIQPVKGDDDRTVTIILDAKEWNEKNPILEKRDIINSDNVPNAEGKE